MIEILREIRRLLRIRHTTAVHDPRVREDEEIRAVVAMLLLEAAYGDEEYVWCEHQTIVRGLKRVFGLSRAEVDDVLARARFLRPPGMRLSEATRFLTRNLDEPDRQAIVELLLRVVDADGITEEWERAFVEAVSEALGLDEQSLECIRRRLAESGGYFVGVAASLEGSPGESTAFGEKVSVTSSSAMRSP